ncbi:hypothetical protein P4475_17930 [Halalkalibacterium halodurans]|uniref:hypothetical protein n=1 Tax=Halalkalibacterium halodurans TaxID=86665 RepID=UPI002E226230|nr:hypothetical protein [Halalkalibacterium halodurans]
MEKFDNVVWEGRFQPIHIGHLAYIDKLLNYGNNVWIYVVANENSMDLNMEKSHLVVPEFTKIVDPHHRPEKNILPFWLRYKIVWETIREEFGPSAPIYISGGRRLDLGWDLYKKILPPNRVFITPKRDSFEDEKAKAWKTLGETCERIEVDDLPNISATMIRERIANGQSVNDLLSTTTIRLLKEYGYLKKLEEI